MNVVRLKYGTAVLATLTLGIAAFYTWDRTRVKTEDIVELVEACSERLLVIAPQTGVSTNIIVLGSLTNTFLLPIYGATTNMIVTTNVVYSPAGTNRYRIGGSGTNTVYTNYVASNGISVVTNWFVSTGQYFRTWSAFEEHDGRTMTVLTNIVTNGTTIVTNLWIQDHQVSVVTNVANAIGIFNNQSLMAWIDAAIYYAIPRYVDHTKKTNGIYDAWFSSHSNVSLVVPPLWSTTGIFTYAGIGDTNSGTFTWPTNGQYVGPITISNLWERYVILSLLQETYVDAAFSNRILVTSKLNDIFWVDFSGSYYSPYVTNVNYWAAIIASGYFPSNGWSIDCWSQLAGLPLVSNYNMTGNYQVFLDQELTNVITVPLGYRHNVSLQLGSSTNVTVRLSGSVLEGGGSTFNVDTPLQDRSETINNEQWGESVGRLFRPANQNALGISGAVDLYGRWGTSTLYGGDGSGRLRYIGGTSTSTCMKVGEVLTVDGAAQAFADVTIDTNITHPALSFEFHSSTNYVTTNGSVYTYYSDCVFYASNGVIFTNHLYAPAMLSGPAITRWNFMRCTNAFR